MQLLKVRAAGAAGLSGGSRCRRAAAVARAADSNGMRPLSSNGSSAPAPASSPPAKAPASTSGAEPGAASSSAAPAKPPKNYTVTLFDAMKFNGPAPELVNGRLAMIGLMAAASQEAETGATVMQQLSHVSLGVCAAMAVWVYASLVPIMKGVKQEAFGFFSPRAELTNGRAAMLGFAALMLLEASAGVPFF